VNAAGAWADDVAASAGLATAGLTPLKRTAFVAPVRADTTGLPLVLAADSSFYVKPDVPGVVLGSRADETPMEPCDPRAEEIDVAYAIDRINAHTTLDLRSVHRTWAGLRVFAADRQPLVEPHRHDASFVWCAGLGGTGVQTSPAVGARVAELAAAAVA
jgi:D-arginine dehydrogenase